MSSWGLLEMALPLPGRVLERQPPPYPLAWEVFPASLSLNKRLSVPCFPAALPAATAQVWNPNLQAAEGLELAGWSHSGPRGQRAISLTPVLSIRSLRRKSTAGTRLDTQGVVLGASRCLVWPVGICVCSSALTWVSPHPHPLESWEVVCPGSWVW